MDFKPRRAPSVQRAIPVVPPREAAVSSTIPRSPVTPIPMPSPAGSGQGQEPPRRKLPKRRLLLIIAAVIVIALVGFAVIYGLSGEWKKEVNTGKNAKASSSGSAPTTSAAPTSIRFIATGDFIAHDSVNTAAQKSGGTYDYLPMMDDFLPIFKGADIRFCNDPILNGGKQFGIIGYPTFNSPTEFVTDMGRLGCNVVNTASNHSFDKTQDAITASVQAWKNVPNVLAVAGQNSSQAEHDTVHYFTVKGVKFAFLAYTTYTNNPVQNSYGVNMFSQDFASKQIAEAKQNGAQIIVASMRWGTEYSGDVNAAQKQNAQFLADQGVSIVLGHGPHVLQTVQQLTGAGGNKTLVWYSLGNFLNTQEPAETLFNGLAVMDIDIKTKQVTATKYLPIYMHYEWTPAQAAADNIAARNNLHLYLLEDATQAMIDAQQLKTTVDAQKTRMQNTLNADGLTIPLITKGGY